MCLSANLSSSLIPTFTTTLCLGLTLVMTITLSVIRTLTLIIIRAPNSYPSPENNPSLNNDTNPSPSLGVDDEEDDEEVDWKAHYCWENSRDDYVEVSRLGLRLESGLESALALV